MWLRKAILVALVTMLFTDFLSLAFLGSFLRFHVPILLGFASIFVILAACSLVVEAVLIVWAVCFE